MVGEIDGESALEMRRSSCRMRQRASLDEECTLTREEGYGKENRGMNRRRMTSALARGTKGPTSDSLCLLLRSPMGGGANVLRQ